MNQEVMQQIQTECKKKFESRYLFLHLFHFLMLKSKRPSQELSIRLGQISQKIPHAVTN